MDKQEWKKIFKKRHLDNLLSGDYDDDSKKEVVDEGEDFFVIETDDYYQTTYYFDEAEAQQIENALIENWNLTDFVKEQETGQYYSIRLENQNQSIKIWTKSFIENTREMEQKILKFEIEKEDINKKTLHLLIKKVKESLKEEVSYARGTIVKMLTEEELKEKFGEHANNLLIPVSHLNLSMRSFNCLMREDYETVFDIVWDKKENIETIAQLGHKCYTEILEKIDELKLEWNIKNKIAI